MKEEDSASETLSSGDPSNYAIQFGAALIAYLMAGLTVLTLLPNPHVWRESALIDVACLAFAVFARFRWKWRGFLAGALVAVGFVTTMQLLLLLFMQLFWPATV